MTAYLLNFKGSNARSLSESEISSFTVVLELVRGNVEQPSWVNSPCYMFLAFVMIPLLVIMMSVWLDTHGIAWLGCNATCEFVGNDLVSYAALSRHYLFFDFHCLRIYILALLASYLTLLGS